MINYATTLLYILTFFLFLTIPGSITGAIFIASTVAYWVKRSYR